MNYMKIPPQFNIIPVQDKKPLISWKEFTKREQTVQEKQKIYGLCPNGNIGVVTGKVSGIIVLDNDGGLDLEKYKVPKTWTVETPRGGKHYYFRWIPELDNKVTTKTEILPKVDIRGDGGFVVFYGFQKPISITSLAQPPKWLIDLLPNKFEQLNSDKRSDVKESNLITALDGIKEGNRNDSFTRIAGSLRSRGYSIDEIYSFLQDKARSVNFSVNELRTICESVGRYEPNSHDTCSSTESANGLSIEEFLKEQEIVEWLVPGIIAKKSICFVAGLPETGKTWMIIDLAIECAKETNGLWLKRFPVKHAKVLFIDQERFKGETQRRFRSVLSAKHLDGAILKSNLFIRCGTSTRLDLLHSYDAFHKEISEIRPDLVIIDSFATFHTKEENNRKDIQEVLERIKQIRTEFGCTFLFIHHENKYAFNKDGDQEPSISQMAGSIAIPAACETVMTVRKHDSESSMVYHTKSTLSSVVPPFLIKVIDMNEAKTAISIEAF